MKKILLLSFCSLVFLSSTTHAQAFFTDPEFRDRECKTMPADIGTCLPFAGAVLNQTTMMVATCNNKIELLAQLGTNDPWKEVTIPEHFFAKDSMEASIIYTAITPEGNTYEVQAEINYLSNLEQEKQVSLIVPATFVLSPDLYVVAYVLK